MADYYGDEEGAQPRPGPDTGPPEEAPEKDDSEAQTALIPKALCAGHDLGVGDTVTLKIVGVHDAEYEVAYSGKESEKEPESETEPETHVPDKPQRSRWDEMMD